MSYMYVNVLKMVKKRGRHVEMKWLFGSGTQFSINFQSVKHYKTTT